MHVEVRGQLAAMTPPPPCGSQGIQLKLLGPVPLHAEHLTSPSVGIYLSYFMNKFITYSSLYYMT